MREAADAPQPPAPLFQGVPGVDVLSYGLYVAQSFDIIYRPVQILGYPEPDTTVMARRVEAIDRTHALLWWIRNELGLKVDPVEMFDQPYESEADCGCDIHLSFEMHQLGRIARIRRGEQAVPTADIECEPCDLHAEAVGRRSPHEHRDWNGALAAWKHDPKRPDTSRAD